MEEFPFKFNLNYQSEEYTINPPNNLNQLKEISSKQFNVTIQDITYHNEDEEDVSLKGEEDYAELIEDATNQHLNEVAIYINPEKKQTDEMKEIEDDTNVSNENEDPKTNCDYDYYGDTRNRKGKMEYNKHNKGLKEQKRIKYIKEKKQMQREETKKNRYKKTNKNIL